MPYNAKEQELEILKHWDKTDAFRKSVENRPLNKRYAFYDGPPFATGLPHYGHIVASVMKDVVPRYWTMQGRRVERVWGWDCHGLPIENIVEKELGTKSKKDIVEMGVAEFNERCRSKVLSYVGEWEKTITRLGRWVDMEHAYRTMDTDYMESVWWVFKELHSKGLIYPGFRPMHICPRCETTLSQQEVSEGYKDIKDLSATVKFELVDEPGTFVLAWTTTPWTLIGNSALAIDKTGKIEYVKVEILESEKDNLIKGEKYIFSKSYLEKNFTSIAEVKVRVSDFDVKDLIGKNYNPLFDYYLTNEGVPQVESQQIRNGWKIYGADFVNEDEGTGVIHIAPAFGEDDANLSKEHNLPFIQHVGMNGIIEEKARDFAGMNVTPRAKNDPKEIREIDLKIVKFLGDKIFNSQKYTHSYPHCWRCDTPLLNYATSSWFVDVKSLKQKALGLAKNINWSPEHIKEGRFGKWLEGARDWSISRQRFWASVMPVWVCEGKVPGKRGTTQKCGNTLVFGSVADLEKVSGKKVDDLHKHVVDLITFPCEKCGATMKRIPDVLDTWFDSGSMPYAQIHWMGGKNGKQEPPNFPAEFIAEGQDQTRAWFYYLHILAVGLFGKAAYKNVIVNGIVLAEDGKKMSKKLQNYPDPNLILEKYGADALRYYLLTSPVMMAENLNFSEAGVREMYNKLVNILWNVCEFYEIFSEKLKAQNSKLKTTHILDRWILSKLNILVKEVTKGMEEYKLAEASRPIVEFVTELSQWYVRRSRDRFKGEDEEDKAAALATLHTVLLTLSKVMAPFTPFIAEKIYQKVGGEMESVHLEDFPVCNKKEIDEKVLEEMKNVRQVVEMGLALRAAAGIKVRQTLSKLFFHGVTLSDTGKKIVEDELNVKSVVEDVVESTEFVTIKEDGKVKVGLDTEMTPELKKEGLVREVVRAINQMRKEAGLTVEDRVVMYWHTEDKQLRSVFESYGKEIGVAVLADKLEEKKNTGKVKIGEVEVSLTIEKK